MRFPFPYPIFFAFIHTSSSLGFVLSSPTFVLIADRIFLAYVRSRVNPAAPYPPSKPTRRPAHTSQPTATLSSMRRGSLPALHLHTSPQSAHTVSVAPPDMQENSENHNDDLYSHLNLAAFSFGAPVVHQDTDMPSPLSVQAPSESGHSYSTGSTDRTPRPSISQPRDSGDSGGEDEPRRIRKMRAIDDGGRRPSLPTNRYTVDRPGSDDSAGPSPRSNPETSGSDSEPIASGVVDTDVELEGIAPDDASQHTFGLEQYDWYVVDPNERRQEAGSPVTFANGSDDDDDSDVSETGTRALAAIRRSSIAIRMASTRDRSFHAGDPDFVSTQSNARQREDSTTTVRRSSYGDTEGGSPLTATSSNRDQQPPLPPANWSMFTNNAGISPTDDSGRRVYQGMDLGYIMNVDPEGLNTRRSSLSFIAPQTLPLPPAKDKRKSKDKEKRKKDKEKGKAEDFDTSVMRGLIGSPSHPSNLLDVAPWAEADDRRPSIMTLDDSFAGGLRRDDPDYALRRNRWSFIRIGQIRIERATLPPSDPNKPNQQRLNAEHDVDPDSANTFGGPTTVVHRHSRALAVLHLPSLQPEKLPLGQNSQQYGDSEHTEPQGPAKLEQFTTTKSTVKLDTHGLLPEEGDNRRDARREPNLTHPSPRSSSLVGELEGLDSQTSSIRGASTSHISGSLLNLSGVTAFASSASTSQSVSSTASIMTSSESSISERQLTPHDEAFATLDKRAIDQLKNEQVPTAARRSPSWFHRIIGPTGSSTPRAVPSSLAPIDPPWLTLAPRSMQEEQDRAIQGLRSSFKDVGLVPSTRSRGGAGIGRKGKYKNKDMLTQVPDDSLVLDQEQNLYLLVYYVPFDKQGEGNAAKKRSRSRPRKGERERPHPTPLFDVHRGFKVIGRLISHSDLNGSGIRLPVRGLSVTGPLAEAELGIPPASLRDVHSDDFVIGACLDRRGTIEFVPEGLEKLGLCVPRTESVQLHTHPGMQTEDPVEEDIVSQPLTAVGRAAVEVAWLGCMALMTFYGPQTQSPT
ncbi:hypothetical protein H4582DRAFT_2077012 [Lactarius indigo]|nr:hypothetical protein H4582DRAFT_2077012 [Lactarius indigo]